MCNASGQCNGGKQLARIYSGRILFHNPELTRKTEITVFTEMTVFTKMTHEITGMTIESTEMIMSIKNCVFTTNILKYIHFYLYL